MATEGQTGSNTQEEFHEKLSQALREGDTSKVDALMAEEVQPEEVVEEVVTTPETTAIEPKTPEAAPETPSEPVLGNWEDSLDEEAKGKVKALRDERDAMDRRIRSELGRVPYLQREMAELKRKLQEPRQPEPTQAPAAPAPKQSKFAEKLAQIREIDPVLADTFEDAMKELRDEVVTPLREELGNEIKEVRNVFRDRDEESLWSQEKAKLLAAVPQADEIFKLPLYREWKEQLSPSQKQLAGSIYADDVVVALEQFSKYVARVHPELVPQQPAAPVTTQAPPVNPQAAKAQEARERKLVAKPPGSAPTPPKSGDGFPDDPDELHRFFVKKIRAGEM